MKKNILLLTIILTLAACKNQGNIGVGGTQEGGKGNLELSLSAQSEIIVESKTKDETNVNVNLSEFSVKITNDNNEIVEKFDSFDNVPQSVELNSGLYKIVAQNNASEGAHFNSPLFYGEQLASIELGKTTRETVICKLKQAKITINFSENLLAKVSNLSAILSAQYTALDGTEGHSAIIEYKAQDTGKSCWMTQPTNGQIKIYVSGKNESTGELINMTTYISEVKNAEWRTLDCDIKTSGSLGLIIELEDNIVVMPDTDIVIPDNDDIIDGGGGGNIDTDHGNGGDQNGDKEDDTTTPAKNPKITGAAFGTEQNNSPFDIAQPVKFYVSQHSVLDILLESETGIEKLLLEIESEALASLLGPVLGITGEIDLANPDTEAQWYTMFQDPLIDILDANEPIKGKTEHTFSVGKLMALLSGIATNSGDSHYFHLSVVDENGTTSKTLTIVLFTE